MHALGIIHSGNFDNAKCKLFLDRFLHLFNQNELFVPLGKTTFDDFICYPISKLKVALNLQSKPQSTKLQS